MGAPLDPARSYRPDRLGALQRLDLGLLVHTDHDRVRRWVQVEPDHVADLGLQLRIGGELERLGLPRLDVMLGPDPRDRAVADAELGGQQPARPVSDAKRLGRWREGGGQYLGAPVTPNRLWAAGAGRSASWPVSPSRAYRLRQAITVGREMPSRSAISVLETPSAANNSSLARRTRVAGTWAAHAQRRKTASSAGGTGRAAAEDGIHRYSRPPTQPSNHLRDALLARKRRHRYKGTSQPNSLSFLGYAPTYQSLQVVEAICFETPREISEPR